MRKLLLIPVFTALLIGLSTSDNILWAKRILLGNHTVHVVQKGETLSDISLQYYGTAKYWKALAVLNRAPDSDLIFPDERIVIPDKEAVNNVRRARSITAVNQIMGNVVEFLALKQTENASDLTHAEPEAASSQVEDQSAQSTSPKTIENQTNELSANKTTERTATASVFPKVAQTEPASFNTAWLLVPLAVVGLVLLLAIWRKRKKQNENGTHIDNKGILQTIAQIFAHEHKKTGNTAEENRGDFAEKNSVLSGFDSVDYRDEELDYSDEDAERNKVKDVVPVV